MKLSTMCCWVLLLSAIICQGGWAESGRNTVVSQFSINKQSYLYGEDIVVRIGVRNVTDKAISVPEPYPGNGELNIQLYNSQGRIVEPQFRGGVSGYRVVISRGGEYSTDYSLIDNMFPGFLDADSYRLVILSNDAVCGTVSFRVSEQTAAQRDHYLAWKAFMLIGEREHRISAYREYTARYAYSPGSKLSIDAAVRYAEDLSHCRRNGEAIAFLQTKVNDSRNLRMLAAHINRQAGNYDQAISLMRNISARVARDWTVENNRRMGRSTSDEILAGGRLSGNER